MSGTTGWPKIELGGWDDDVAFLVRGRLSDEEARAAVLDAGEADEPLEVHSAYRWRVVPVTGKEWDAEWLPAPSGGRGSFPARLVIARDHFR